MGASNPLVDHKHFDTPEELLEWLSPTRDNWGARPRQWVFRGQSSAAWGLRPSAFRAGAGDAKRHVARHAPGRARRDSQWVQIRYELELMRNFAVFADVQGLPVPVDTSALDMLESWYRDRAWPDAAPDSWPPPELWSLAALCQHYGVPTRLLDWTRKPLIAAYFAAEGAVRMLACAPADGREGALTPGRAHGRAQLAIWALRRRLSEKELTQLHTFDIREIHAPCSSNPNLHLQSGLFTLLTSRCPLEDEVDLRTIPDVMTRDRIAELPGWDGLPLLWQLTLPHAMAPRLLQLLRDHFVHGGVVFAGYEGVSRAVREYGLSNEEDALNH